MNSRLKTLLNDLLALVYPTNTHCAICGRLLFSGNASFCGKCLEKLVPVKHRCVRCGRSCDHEAVCLHCLRGETRYEKALALYVYDERSKALIIDLKYRGNRWAAEKLGEMLAAACLSDAEFFACDVVSFVPASPERLRERGFNQAELLARAVSAHMEKPLLPLLAMKSGAVHQVGLSEAEREHNVRFSVECAENDIAGKSVLVIDDVLTTGATFNECAALLAAAGARRVYCASVLSVSELTGRK